VERVNGFVHGVQITDAIHHIGAHRSMGEIPFQWPIFSTVALDDWLLETHSGYPIRMDFSWVTATAAKGIGRKK